MMRSRADVKFWKEENCDLRSCLNRKAILFVFSLMIKLCCRRINTSWWYSSWETMSRCRLCRFSNSMSQNRHEKVARELKNSIEVYCCFMSSRNVITENQTKIRSSLMFRKQSRSMIFKSIWKQSTTSPNFASCEWRVNVNAFLFFCFFNSHRVVDIA